MLHIDALALQGVNTEPHVSETSLFFLVGTSGKTMAFFFFNIHMYLYYMAT